MSIKSRPRLTIFVVLAMISSPLLRAAEVPLAWMQGLGETHYNRVDSTSLEQTYHLYVRLPEGYATSGDTTYPTVYLLDGGLTYPLLAGYYRYLRLGEEVPDTILVGISYGTEDWTKGNARSRDFTAPSEEREHWGGATAFQEVLERELIALVESRYRSDPNRRILFGQSLGGQFVLFSALTRVDLFWGRIASNPALHRNLEVFLEPRAREAKSDSRTRLFVSSGSRDDPQFRTPALAWIESWSARTSTPWDLETTTLEGQSHFSAVPAAFRQGMRWLFTEEHSD